MLKIASLISALLLASHLAGCATAVVGGAAAGGSIAADRRTAGAYVEDENIELKAFKKMESNLGEESHVNVTSINGSVLLTGEVPNAELKTKAETLAKSISHVKNITNEIVVGMKSSIADRANDTYITSKVKANLVAEKDFPSNAVKVVTEASTVYLMGVVTQKEASIATEVTRNTDGVKKVVKVFEYLP